MTAKCTLLLAPGLLCDAAAWTAQIAALSDDVDAIVLDHGDADSLGAMADAALARVPGDFAIAGHSMGGRVALEVMRRAPARVRGIAVLDTGCRARAAGDAGLSESKGRLALVEFAKQKGLRAMSRVWVQNMVHPSRLADVALLDVIAEMFARRNIGVFAAQQKALIERPDAWDVVAGIRCPALFLCGDADRNAPPEALREQAAAVPGGEVVVVPECGHMATLERPEAVTRALQDWLARIA